MTTTSLPYPGESSADRVQAADENYLSHGHGLRSWLTTLDHKRIAVLYLIAILTAFFLGGFFAMLMRTELLTPERTIMGPKTYNQMFTLHGAIMIFLFIIPGIPAIFGNFALPLMLGAKDVAFPRLNLASWYFYVGGSLFAILSIILGGVDTGWTFYTPYSTQFGGQVIPLIFGVFILGFSSIFTGLNFIVTIHRLRPPGMGWFQMPLFLWALYATAIIQVLATPVLGITLLLLIAERVLGVGIFDPTYGGDPVLFQHFFWFYSHPAVYIMILPAMGIMSEVVSVFSRKHIFGYKFLAYASLAIAVIGFFIWGHHMFTTQSALANLIFSALTFAVAIPSAIKVFNWIATMYKGSIGLGTPMCYALSFIAMFAIGGMTGLFLGSLGPNIHLHDTYFVVAHFHYVIMGGSVLMFLAGLHYWWPKMFGRMYSEFWGRLTCLMVFIGFNLTFFPQFVMGSQGMPRRYYNYIEQFRSFHQASSVGGYFLGVAFLVMLTYFLYALFKGPRAPANPWGGASNEWRCASPPPHHNFKEPPPFRFPYDFSGMVYDKDRGGYVIPEDETTET